MKLKIKVTKEILRKSMLCGTTFGSKVAANCAVSLAVREIFPNALTGNDSIVIDSLNLSKGEILLPYEAMVFIRKFDGLKIIPHLRPHLPELEFEVELPQDYIDSINIDEIKELLKDSKTLELV
jgi:hypothetical protein